jgi:sugar phosphate isomerase/epimerase
MDGHYRDNEKGKRKTMFKKTVFLLSLWAIICMLSSCGSGRYRITDNSHPITESHGKWRLGTQAYTFRKFTFFEAVEKAESLGLNWIEAYPGQTLSKETGELRFNHETTAEIRDMVKKRLAGSRVRVVNYGVVGLANDEAECRKVFDFARDMGIETIVSEPSDEAFDLIEKLCEEYKIKVAIHNHPKNSKYWNPETVLAACKGRSKLIGACADTGHWMRSGVDPLEAVKKLKGRIVSLHFKDLNEFGVREAHDVIWGTGKANIRAILEELNRQKFEGVFSIEYEHNWENSVPEIRQCVAYFNSVASELDVTGWRDLVSADLSNCTYKEGSWEVEDGVLTRKGTNSSREDIWTKERYGDFMLDLEFMVAEQTNSGIFFRTDNIHDPVQTGIEIQVFDSQKVEKPGTHDCGSVYDCLAPSKNMVKEPGEWNRCTLTCKANRIYVVLNGEQVIDMDLNEWTEVGKNPDGSKNKFKKPYKDMSRTGHFGFQDHGHPVWYRNIKVKPLD